MDYVEERRNKERDRKDAEARTERILSIARGLRDCEHISRKIEWLQKSAELRVGAETLFDLQTQFAHYIQECRDLPEQERTSWTDELLTLDLLESDAGARLADLRRRISEYKPPSPSQAKSVQTELERIPAYLRLLLAHWGSIQIVRRKLQLR